MTAQYIDQAALEVFTEWAEKSSINEAIECACGQFWEEGEANALACLTGAGNFWKYLEENTGFFDSKEVLERAGELKAAQDEAEKEQAKLDRVGL